MTDQQKEEEAMFKHTFNFYLQQKGGVPLERYELPMILDGKFSACCQCQVSSTLAPHPLEYLRADYL